MEQKVYEVDCEPSCGFMVRSHNKQEVESMSIEHVKNAHHHKISKAEVDRMMLVI